MFSMCNSEKAKTLIIVLKAFQINSKKYAQWNNSTVRKGIKISSEEIAIFTIKNKNENQHTKLIRMVRKVDR